MRRLIPAVAAVALLLAGCTADPLADRFGNGTQQNYVSGDGSVLELPAAERDAAVEFAEETDAGDTASSADYAGEVLVVNFWFAGCPPCQVEAPDLAELSRDYADQGVSFLGVNVYDEADAARTFAKKFGIEYPSILDVGSGSTQLAFAGTVAPNAVPTTLVVDRAGRVAGRISGLVEEPAILAAMIDRVLAESR